MSFRSTSFPVALTALLLGVASPAAAQVDCEDRESEASALYCEDPFVDKLAGALGEANDEAWHNAVRSRCGFRDDGSLPENRKWTASPCVVSAYQAKLREVQGQVPAELSTATLRDLPGVHPLCIKLAVAQANDEAGASRASVVPLRDCNRRFSHIDVDTGGSRFSSEAPGDENAFFSYRIVGKLSDGVTVVESVESTGGTGRFSAVSLFGAWPGAGAVSDPKAQLRYAGGMAFGDRCNGGLDDVKLAGPRKIGVRINVTPAELFTAEVSAALKWSAKAGRYETVEQPSIGPSAKIAALEPYNDLDAAAASCLGYVSVEFDLGSARAQLASTTIVELNTDKAWVERFRHQACFNKVVGDSAGALPKTMTPAETRSLAGLFERTCLK